MRLAHGRPDLAWLVIADALAVFAFDAGVLDDHGDTAAVGRLGVDEPVDAGLELAGADVARGGEGREYQRRRVPA